MPNRNKETRYEIGRLLRHYRKECHMSIDDVADYLRRNNIQDVQPSTIYSWENGTYSPNTNVFLELCKLYHISEILYTFGYDSMPTERQLVNSLSSIEQHIILAYRSNKKMQEPIRLLLGMKC